MPTVVIRTVLIYIILNITLRILGKRQLGELEVPELVTTLLLSELATTVISDASLPFSYSLIPLGIIACFELLTSIVKNKSPMLKRVFEGSPNVLISRGVLDQEALKKTRISVEELLAAFRLQGVLSISEVYYAILEQNGQLSVILRKDCAQPTAKDLGLALTETGISHAIVVDGQVKKAELSVAGRTERWLANTLRELAIETPDVFLLTVDDSGEVVCIPKAKKKK